MLAQIYGQDFSSKVSASKSGEVSRSSAAASSLAASTITSSKTLDNNNSSASGTDDDEVRVINKRDMISPPPPQIPDLSLVEGLDLHLSLHAVGNGASYSPPSSPTSSLLSGSQSEVSLILDSLDELLLANDTVSCWHIASTSTSDVGGGDTSNTNNAAANCTTPTSANLSEGEVR